MPICLPACGLPIGSIERILKSILVDPDRMLVDRLAPTSKPLRVYCSTPVPVDRDTTDTEMSVRWRVWTVLRRSAGGHLGDRGD